MPAETISIKEARLLALNCQGLAGNTSFGKGKKGTLNTIEQLGYVQIDTLAVVARAHHHILWSRIKNYNESFLNELLEKDKKIFEYWSHAASYLPMSEYRYSLYKKSLYVTGKSHWFKQDKKIKQYVLNKIISEGPLQSKDFEHTRKKTGQWYEWKPAKKALEQLFMEGILMVSKRQGFQKVYDLTERVLPSNINTSEPDENEYAEYLIKKVIGSHGFATEKEICYLRNSIREPVNKKLKELSEHKVIIPITIEGIEKSIFYTTKENLQLLNRIQKQDTVHLLSPFDNILIQRKRIEQLFGYRYQVECYVPEPKRIYGYFCLPILAGDEFIGRFDPKTDRKTRTFYIKHFHLEKKISNSDLIFPQVCLAIKSFAEFNGCNRIILEKATPKSLTKSIRNFLC